VYKNYFLYRLNVTNSSKIDKEIASTISGSIEKQFPT